MMGMKNIEHAHKLCCMFGAPFVDDDHAYKLALFTTEMTTDALFYGPRRQHKDLIKLLNTTCEYSINVYYTQLREALSGHLLIDNTGLRKAFFRCLTNHKNVQLDCFQSNRREVWSIVSIKVVFRQPPGLNIVANEQKGEATPMCTTIISNPLSPSMQVEDVM